MQADRGIKLAMLHLELWRPALLAVLLLGTANAAAAQEVTQGATQDFVNLAENAYASVTPDDVASHSEDVAPKIVDRVPIEIDEETLAKALSAESLLPIAPGTRKTKPLVRRNGLSNSAKWNRVDNPDGSANYTVSKPLAAPWDARIGADISTAAPPPDFLAPGQLPGTLPSDAGSGSAWADLAVPHLATIEVRAEPGNDYDKVGTKLERSLPLGKSFSVTAQSSLGITEIAPLAPSADAATRLFSTDNSLQLNMIATGTSLTAGASTTTGDPVTHSRFSAAQKVYGPLNVTGTVNDPGQPSNNMSLTAGMNFTW
jgi:hypothetical protein